MNDADGKSEPINILSYMVVFDGDEYHARKFNEKNHPKKQIQATKPLEWFLVFFGGGFF